MAQLCKDTDAATHKPLWWTHSTVDVQTWRADRRTYAKSAAILMAENATYSLDGTAFASGPASH